MRNFLSHLNLISSECLTKSQRSGISYAPNNLDQTLTNLGYYCWSWAQSIFLIALARIKFRHITIIWIEVTLGCFYCEEEWLQIAVSCWYSQFYSNACSLLLGVMQKRSLVQLLSLGMFGKIVRFDVWSLQIWSGSNLCEDSEVGFWFTPISNVNQSCA